MGGVVKFVGLFVGASFGVVFAQSISSITPAFGNQGATLSSVAVVGSNTNFVNGTSVASFSGSGITVNSTAVTDATHATLNITIASGAPTGPQTVSISTNTEVASLSNGFTVTAPPSINSVLPTSGAQGQTLSVGVAGSNTNFVNGTTVGSFSGAGITVNSTAVTDSTHATLNITIAGGASLGARTVTLTTNAEAASLANGFTVTAPPTISSVLPVNGAQSQTLSVAVTGANTHFVNGTTVGSFSGSGITVNSTAVTDSTHATLNITIAGGASLGARTVTLTTNTEVASLANGFTVTAPPTISSVLPVNGAQGQTLSVAATGANTNLVNGTTVGSLSGTGITVNSTTVTDSTHATLNITIAGGASLGARTVTLTTNAEVASLANGFAVTAPPTISSVLPVNGAQGQTLSVAITGANTNFVNGTTVGSFSGTGITVNSTSVTDSTHATVNITIAGGAALGARTVTMTTNTEVASLANGFSVIAPPAISSISPATGAQGLTLSVNVAGSNTNFVNGTTLGSLSGTGITVNSTSVTDSTHATLNLTIASNAPVGTRTVTMTTGSEVVSLTSGFNVTAAPSIISLVPAAGVQGQTLASVSVVGSNTNFVNGTTTGSFSGTGITVNSTAVTDATHATLNITIASGATLGARTLTMTTSLEVASLVNGFTVTAAPSISSITPSSGVQGQILASVGVIGTNTSFVNGTTIASFSGTGITVNSTTVTDTTHATLNITIAGNAPTGTRTLTMTTNLEVASLTNGFSVNQGVPTQLGFSTQPPPNGTAGTPFSTTVQVQDASGNVVTSSNASITIASTPAGVGGTTTVAAVNGVATFNNLVLTSTGSYTLKATASSLTSATSTSITIAPGPANQIIFAPVPSGGTAGQALTPAVVATVEDAFNNTVNSSAPISISSTPSGVSGTLQVNATNGVATFSNLVFNVAGSYTLTAASPGLKSATSGSITVSPGSGNKLVFTVQPPANGMAGQALSPTLAVQVQDAQGNLVTSSTANITISSTPSGVGGTVTANASGGIATFNNLVFTTTGNFTLTATAGGLTNATSTPVAIAAGAASKLVFTVQPSSATSGQSLTPAVVVQVQDANGNLVNTSSAAVTISSTPGGAGGTLTVNAVNGVATFSNLSFTATGNYTLTAASTGLSNAVSSSFTISAGSGNKLAITVQPPATGTAGQALSPAVVVQIQDANGNLVTSSSAAVSIGSTPPGAGGTLTVNASGGVATFTNLVFNSTGSYTLTATSTGLSNATTTPVVIAAGAATKLAFTVQPSSGTAGQAITPAVVVAVQDANGNVVTSSTAAVTLSSAPAGAGGATSVNAVNGIATFTNLVFSTTGNYTLTASASALSSANSNSLTISPGSGNKLAFTTQPAATGVAGQVISPPVVVQIQDANGNLVTTSNAAVSISATVSTADNGFPTIGINGPAGTPGATAAVTAGGIGGTLTVNAVGGIATFNNLIFTVTGTYTLTATSTGLANATSTPTAIAPGAASKIAFTVQPSSGSATQALSPAVIVQIQDSFGNLATSSNSAVTITSTPAGAGGTLSTFAQNGVATFNNLTFNSAGNYTLTATASGLTTVNSNSFTIAAGAPGGISIVSGNGQSALIGRSFTNPFVVVVKDSAGNAVPNVTVTFTAPATGASGTFNGAFTATATTSATGQATSPAFTANSTPGSYTVVASAAGVGTTASFGMTNVGTLAIATALLNVATQAQPYSQQLTASGGVPPYTWSLTAGTLPSGLSLFSSGLISGTPTGTGNFPITAHVRDSAGATADQALVLAVSNSVSISSCPASTGIVGQPYSSSAAATGGQIPYTWSFTTGAFPPGLSLNALTGTVTGIPTSSGTFTVTLVVTDKSNVSASLGCGFTIAPALSITTATISDASQNSPYSQTLIAAGGKPPYTWRVTASGNLPPGLSLSANGVLSGTPTQLGSFTFTVAVTDTVPNTVTQTYTMNVLTGLIVGACPQSTSEVGLPYNSSLVAEGGSSPYTWSLTGLLPAGLQLNSIAGTISGTPTQVGAAAITLTATDRASRTSSKPCSISVQPALAISTTALSGGSTGASYTDSVNVNGGVSPYVFATTAGSLPPGLAIDGATGKITGRPITAGTFSFAVQVTDNLGAQSTQNLSITIAQGLTIPNCPAPVGSVGQSYSAPLVAQGGTPPYTWSITSGSLPGGLTLDASNAIISGANPQPGSASFVLQATDSGRSSATRACSIQINAAALAITSSTALPNALLGTPYSQTLTATGGVAPYVWSIVGSGLPDGFSLDPSSGVVSGTSSSVGTFTFTVQATDQSSNVARQTFTLLVLAGTAPNVSISGLTDIVDPAAQPAFNLQLAGSYPAPIDGTLTLTVVPDPAIGVDDPAIQFATGGRTLKFTVPANATAPQFTAPVVAIQTGTVASTIQLSLKLTSAGTDITPSSAPLRTVRVDRLAPKIVSITATQSSGGIQVTIVGYSTTREVTQGTFQFTVSGGGSPLSAAVQLSSAATTWFQSASSTAFGGQFKLTQPFTLQGSVGTLTSVTVTLTNGQGTSAPATANF